MGRQRAETDSQLIGEGVTSDERVTSGGRVGGGDELDYAADLEDFLNEGATDNQSYSVTLYRITTTRPGGGKWQRAFLRSFHDEIPPYDLIAQLWGAGKYYLVVSFHSKEKNKRTSTSRIINIDPGYSAGLDNTQNKQASAPVQYQPPGGVGTAEVIGMYQGFMSTLVDLVEKLQPKSNGFDMGAMQNAMGNMLISNFRQNMKMLNEVTQREMVEPEPEPDRRDGGPIFEMLKMLWEQYGQRILSAGKTEQGFFRSLVQSRPEMAELQKNPDQFAAAYQQLCDEQGGENIDRVLNVLNIPVPPRGEGLEGQ